MKPLYVIPLACALAGPAFAQRIPEVQSPPDKTPAYFHPASGQTLQVVEQKQAPKPILGPASGLKVTALEEYIGTSVYDLQTNNSVQNRIIAGENGIAAVFTYSGNSAGDTYPDRGTGYNIKTADWDTEPSARIEDVRTGWPSLVHAGDGSEHVFAHAGSGPIQHWSRASIGSGAWSGTTVPSALPHDLVWPRATNGGSDGNSIHLICVTEPEANGGTPYEGLNGALLYYRSTDGGANWDIQDLLLPEMDSLHFNGIAADTYAISARGNKIAIGVFGEFHDTFVYVSEDNGDTWTRTIVWDWPIDLYTIDDGTDIEGDGIQDTIFNSDGAGAVIIDADDHVHLAFGTMFYTDDIGGVVDEVYTYFPLNGSIIYWNDTYTSAEDIIEIAFSPDNNVDGPAGVTEVGQYGNAGIASHPQFALDDNGNIYVTYMAINDLYFNGVEYYRHVYAVKSDDGGFTWSEEPSDITPDLEEDGWEYTYPSLAPELYNGKLHLIIQRDDEPGIHIQPEDNADPVTDNDMIYLCVTDDLVGVEESMLVQSPVLSLYPNPVQDILTLQSDYGKGSLVQVYDLTGKLVHTSTTVQDKRWSLDTGILDAGVYELVISDGVHRSSSRFLKH